MRVRIAARPLPSVTAGKTRCAKKLQPAARARHRQPSQADRKQQNQDRSERKVREREPDQRNHSHHPVLPAVPVGRGPDSGRHRCRETQRQSRQRQSQRIRIALQHQMGYRVPQPQRLPQVGMQDPRQVASVLGGQRRVQPVRMAQRRHVRRRSPLAEHLHDWIPRNQVDQQKHHREHQPKYRQGQQQTPAARPHSCPHRLASAHAETSRPFPSVPSPGAASSASPAASVSTRTRLMRRPFRSTTANERPA